MYFLRTTKGRKVFLIAAMVLTLIGILAAISNIPADSFSRAQVSEGLNLSGEAKAIVTEFYLDHDQLPSNNVEAGLPPAANIGGKYVSSVQIDSGDIVVTYGNDANSDISGKTLILRPETSGQSVTWLCSSPDIESKNLPHVCRQEHNE